MNTAHCTMHTVHAHCTCTLYMHMHVNIISLEWTLHTVHCTLYMHTVHAHACIHNKPTLHTTHAHARKRIEPAVHTAQCTLQMHVNKIFVWWGLSVLNFFFYIFLVSILQTYFSLEIQTIFIYIYIYTFLVFLPCFLDCKNLS